MKYLTFLVFMFQVVGCISAEPSKPDIALIGVMRQQFIELHNVLNLESLESVQKIHARIILHRDKPRELSGRIRDIFLAAYKPGANAKSKIVAPPRMNFWAFFNKAGEPVCLLTLHTEDVFSVTGLQEASSGICQVVESEQWKGTFRSSGLKEELLCGGAGSTLNGVLPKGSQQVNNPLNDATVGRK